MNETSKGVQLNWCGEVMRPGDRYGGRPENIIDAPRKDRREVITEADLAVIFDNASLPKAGAAKLLQAFTGASRATCYRALDLKGRFSKRLTDESGRLAWRK